MFRESDGANLVGRVSCPTFKPFVTFHRVLRLSAEKKFDFSAFSSPVRTPECDGHIQSLQLIITHACE